MDYRQVEHRSRWSRFILIVLIAVTVGLLLALVWIDLSWRATANSAKQRDLRVKELQGEIVHLDEVLTMSALMAATNGDAAWERRYREFEPQLTSAIEQAMVLAPHDCVAATAQTEEANGKLIAMEHEAFELVHLGKIREAQTILLSPEYAAQKRIYADGMAALDGALQDFVEASATETMRSGQRHLMLNLGVVLLVTLGWSVFFHNMLGSEAALVESHFKLTRLADELAGANQTLESRAAELAHANADLAESNLHLSTEIETRIEAEATQQELHDQLLVATRQAGMAEIATGVLHNVGNALNSVNVSASLAMDMVKQSRVGDLERAIDLLVEHSGDLQNFLTATPRGQLLLPYLTKLTANLQSERAQLCEYLDDLGKNIDHTKQIVKSQQTYAKVTSLDMELDLVGIIEDVLKTLGGSLEQNGIEVVREYDNVLPVRSDKHKVMQILANLVTNAIHALLSSPHEPKQLIVRLWYDGENMMLIEIQDTGVGIDEAHLTKIFQYGFTTKQTGHGFGLHHSALVAREMGGDLRVSSEGPGWGACFTLELPIARDVAANEIELIEAV